MVVVQALLAPVVLVVVEMVEHRTHNLRVLLIQVAVVAVFGLPEDLLAATAAPAS